MSVTIIAPRRFGDDRGWFCETWNKAKLAAQGIDLDFVQDNQSFSKDVGTLRGLHFQTAPMGQAKLVRCLRGRLVDVVVDIRRASPTFGQHVAVELTPDNGKQLLVPVGYAHGFVTLEPDTEIAYKVSAPYSPEHDGGIAWNDPALGIDWPLSGAPVVSAKDAVLPRLSEIDVDFAYDGRPLGPPVEIIP